MFCYIVFTVAANGVVLATENKHKSILYDEQSVHKVEMIAKHIGMVYSGMGPDYRLLVKQARKMAENYYLTYRELIPVAQLVQRVATLMQEYTQSGGVRPFGVSLLICGYDSDRPYLFQCDPSGAYFAWKATAMGKNSINGKTFLEKRLVQNIPIKYLFFIFILIRNLLQFVFQLQQRSGARRCCAHCHPDAEGGIRGPNHRRQH